MIERSFDGQQNHSIPETFPSPFDLQPHPLAVQAARDLQQHLQTINPSEHDFFAAEGGKMFGVLVVQAADAPLNNETSAHAPSANPRLASPCSANERSANERLANAPAAKPRLVYLAAFSGMLGGEWRLRGFAPPVFDVIERQRLLGDGELRLRKIAEDIDALLQSPQRMTLQQKVASLTRQQQHALGEARRRFQQRRQNRQSVRRTLDDRTVRRNNNPQEGVSTQSECALLQSTQSQSTQSQSIQSQSIQSQSVQSKSVQSQIAELARQSQRDKADYKALKREWDKKLEGVQTALDESDHALASLRKTRKLLSRQLQEQLFSGYRLASYRGQGNTRNITEFFTDTLPPGGTGDCASIKLFHSCYQLKLKPICMAEFWWGASPASGVRHHDHFYPACRGKCLPILPHMLDGLSVQSPRYETAVEFPLSMPRTVFEDDHIIVVDKPAGMLSVAGKMVTDSVESRLQARYAGLVPEKLSRMLVHRLDQATSGLMVAAKNASSHKALHQQFETRSVDKCYVAVVDGLIYKACGVVDLPLRVDLDDRPRQMVCRQHGKSATTHYRVLSRTESQTRLKLLPVTGRTHQLRVHLAHSAGLNAPIAGDELYGNAAVRLHLHAERLGFRHPVTGERVDFRSPAPF